MLTVGGSPLATKICTLAEACRVSDDTVMVKISFSQSLSFKLRILQKKIQVIFETNVAAPKDNR
jgi:hypothetical protein